MSCVELLKFNMWSKITRHWILCLNIFFCSTLTLSYSWTHSKPPCKVVVVAGSDSTPFKPSLSISFWFAHKIVYMYENIVCERSKSAAAVELPPLHTVRTLARELLYMSREMKHEFFFFVVELFFTSRSTVGGVSSRASYENTIRSNMQFCDILCDFDQPTTRPNRCRIDIDFSFFIVSSHSGDVVVRKRSSKWYIKLTNTVRKVPIGFKLSIITFSWLYVVFTDLIEDIKNLNQNTIQRQINANETMRNVLSKSI